MGRKLLANCSISALRVLGFRGYALFLLQIARTLPVVLRTRRLTCIDQRMGTRRWIIRFKGSRILADCPHLDAETVGVDDSFAFGGVREIFIRDCYLRDRPRGVAGCRTVVDCGANRGLFSVYAATQARHVVAVEANPLFGRLIHSSMRANHLTNYAVEEAMVGKGGAFPIVSDGDRVGDMSELMARHGIDFIDFLKMDIEGSEFSLFEDTDWLDRVGAIGLEIHPDYGDPETIIRALERHRFRVMMRSEDLRRVSAARQASFIYACRPSTS